MKPPTQIVKTIGIVLFIGCASSQAADWSDNLYLHADLGSSSLAGGATHFRGLSSTGFFRGHGHFVADDGIRGDLAIGYNLTKSLAIEAESGVAWNPGPGPDDSFYQIPVMLNAVCQIPLNNSWKVYFGAGAGEILSTTRSLVPYEAFHTSVVFEDSDTSFGYQAKAGIKYALCRHVEIDLEYRFLAADEYNYRFENAISLIEKVRVNDLYTHSAMVSLTWRF